MPAIEDFKIGLKTVVVMVFGAISLTATVSSVYHGIVYNSERVEYVNDRIDKKTSRNEDLILLNKDEIEELRTLIKELKDDGD
jgi:hypothetical protein